MGCCFSRLFGEELYKDWDTHPAAKQYQLQKRLGEGAFSEVHLATDTHSGAAVALKVVFLNRPGLRPQERAILAREAHLLRMVNHPHIVRCFQVLETPRQQVLVLERLTGGDLLDHLHSLTHYTEAAACTIFQQVVAAVAYLHALGILHRDIKPENILLAKPPEHYAAQQRPIKVKLIDLGMAGVATRGHPSRGCMGSPGFMAPEVVRGGIHRPSMDVYSLGVLLFVMLCGRKPWDPQQSHTLQYAAHPLSSAPGLSDLRFTSLSPEAQQLLLALLADKPKERPTAAEVLRHPWVTNVTAAGEAKGQRVIGRAVQQRLQALANNRRIMGTARGLLMVHGGAQSAVAAYQAAVAQAQAQLRQQAGVVLAGRVPVAPPGSMPPAAATHSTEGAAGGGKGSSQAPGGLKAVSDGVLLPPPERVGAVASGTPAMAPRRCSAPGDTAAAGATGPRPQMTSGTSTQRAVASADGSAARAAAAVAAPAADGSALGRRSVGLGGLIRAAQLQQQQQLGLPAAATASSTSSSGAAIGQAQQPGGATAGRAQGQQLQQVEEEVSSSGGGGVTIPQRTLRRGLSGPVLRQLAVSMFTDTSAWGQHVAPVKALSLSPGALALLEAEEAALLLDAAAASGSLNSNGPLEELLAAAAAGGRSSGGGVAGGAGPAPRAPAAAATAGGAVEVPGGRKGAGGGEAGVAWSPRAALADMLASYRERRALHRALTSLHQASEDEEGPATRPLQAAATAAAGPAGAEGQPSTSGSPAADEHTHLLASSRGDSAGGGGGGQEEGPGGAILAEVTAPPPAAAAAAGPGGAVPAVHPGGDAGERHSSSTAAAAAAVVVAVPPGGTSAQPLAPPGRSHPLGDVQQQAAGHLNQPLHQHQHHQQQLSPASSLQQGPPAGSLGSSFSYADILLMEGPGSCEEGGGSRLALSGAASLETAGAEAGLVAAAAAAAAADNLPLHPQQQQQQQQQGAGGKVRWRPLGVPVGTLPGRQGHSLAPSLPTIDSRPPSRTDLGPVAAVGGGNEGLGSALNVDNSSSATISSSGTTHPPSQPHKRPLGPGKDAAPAAKQQAAAAALAAAAAAEEAGGGWPSGLWLQQPPGQQEALVAPPGAPLLDLVAGFGGGACSRTPGAAPALGLEPGTAAVGAAGQGLDAEGISVVDGESLEEDVQQPVSPRSPRHIRLPQQQDAAGNDYLGVGPAVEEEGPSGLASLPELLQQQAAVGGWRQRRGQQAGGRGGGHHTRYPSDLQHWLSGDVDATTLAMPPAVADVTGGPAELDAAVAEVGRQHAVSSATAAAAAGASAPGQPSSGTRMGQTNLTPPAAMAAAGGQDILMGIPSTSSRAMERHISIKGHRGVSFLSRSGSTDAESQLYVGSYNQHIHSMAAGAGGGGGIRASALTSQTSDGASEMTSPGDTSVHMRRHLREMNRTTSDAAYDDGLFAGAAAAVLGTTALSPAASEVTEVTEVTEAGDDWNDPSLRPSEPGVLPAAAPAAAAKQQGYHSTMPAAPAAAGRASIPAHRPAAAAAVAMPVGLSAQVAAVGASGSRAAGGAAPGSLSMQLISDTGPGSSTAVGAGGGYGSGVVPGTTAWLTRGLSGKYTMFEEGASEEVGGAAGAASATGRSGAQGGRLRGVSGAGAAPVVAGSGSAAVFDDMDDTLWYYAS